MLIISKDTNIGRAYLIGLFPLNLIVLLNKLFMGFFISLNCFVAFSPNNFLTSSLTFSSSAWIIGFSSSLLNSSSTLILGLSASFLTSCFFFLNPLLFFINFGLDFLFLLQ